MTRLVILDRVPNPHRQESQFFASVIESHAPKVRAEVERVGAHRGVPAESVVIASLAPKQGPSKFQKDMAQLVEGLSSQLGEMMKQFTGFQKMLQSTMDSLDTIGT